MAKKMVARVLRITLIDHCIKAALTGRDNRPEHYSITMDTMERMISFGDYLMGHQVNVWERYLSGHKVAQKTPIQSLVAGAIVTLLPENFQHKGILANKDIFKVVNVGRNGNEISRI